MGRHTRAEFAKICGLTSGNLSNYIKRGHVIIDGEFIDDTLFENKEFMRKRQQLSVKKTQTIQPEPEKKLRMLRPDPGNSVESESEDQDTSATEEDEDYESYSKTSAGLLKKKIKVDIQKKIRETAILKLREEKIKGEIVPIDLIKNVFSMHTQSIVTAQKDGIEELLINLSVEVRLSGEQLARLRGKMVEILNNAVDKAIIITQRNMRVVVSEFAITKGVGEHE